MADEMQSFASHTKWDPPFHFFLAPLGLVLLGFSIYGMVKTPDLPHAIGIVLVLWILVAVFKTRIYALKVQDRVIRLEERIRLEKLASDPLRSRIPELTVDQLIGLRFACDAEVAALAQKALAEKLNRKQIKQEIKTWRPDTWRA
jgi:hypothetical protein